VTLLGLVSVVTPLVAQSAPSSPESAELIERERARSTIERALALVARRLDDRAGAIDDWMSAVKQVRELGPSASDFLIAELDTLIPHRFFFAVDMIGRMGVAEANEPLRAAIRIADEEGGAAGRQRKAYACIVLGRLGHLDALDLLDAGTTQAARTEIARELTAIEVTAMALGDKSVPALLKQIERYGKDPLMRDRRVFALKALGRVGDASILPRVRELLDDDSLLVRMESLKLLATLGTSEQVGDTLAEALQDPNARIRKVAAASLEQLNLSDKQFEKLLAHLEVEGDAYVRSLLYRMAAERLGEGAVRLFLTHWGGADRFDRAWLVEAAGRTGTPRILNLLREGLRDEDVSVRLRAVDAIAAIGGSGAHDTLLAVLREEAWPVRLAALDALVAAGDRRAGPRVADLLLSRVLPRFNADNNDRVHVKSLGQALVSLEFVDVADDLAQALETLEDEEAKTTLGSVVSRLRILRERNADPEKWFEGVESAEDDVRHLSIVKMAKIGDERATAALIEAFENASDIERAGILQAIAKFRTTLAEPLVERVLLEPEFDLMVLSGIRDTAAWAARRLGSDRMKEALRRSALRRDGQDYKVLVYLAVLDGPGALPVLRDVWATRVAYPRWDRGLEQDKLQWMMRRISEGLDVWPLDAKPGRLQFQG
jgi:HEAT repeat protein